MLVSHAGSLSLRQRDYYVYDYRAYDVYDHIEHPPTEPQEYDDDL